MNMTKDISWWRPSPGAAECGVCLALHASVRTYGPPAWLVAMIDMQVFTPGVDVPGLNWRLQSSVRNEVFHHLSACCSAPHLPVISGAPAQLESFSSLRLAFERKQIPLT